MGESSQSLTAIVLNATPIGESDRRVVLLTAERGKITAFAKNARRQSSPLLAATSPFCFGDFTVRFGRASYYLNAAHITNYFEPLRASYEAAVYGMYFLELADYYTRENNDERPMLGLLYQSLTALTHPAYDMALVRYTYEIKALALNGEYPGPPPGIPAGAAAALAHIAESPIEKLYTFSVSPAVLAELAEISAAYRRRFLDREMKSLAAVAELTGG
jgi:DNA repair protein RecO (recombination protein O)